MNLFKKKNKALSEKLHNIETLRRKADHGDRLAQYEIAEHYSHAGDEKEAVRWYWRAAEQGHAGAQLALGDTYYLCGIGIGADMEEAAKWVAKAAKQGHATAQDVLGNYYNEGIGVCKDYVVAYAWALLASINGVSELKEELLPTLPAKEIGAGECILGTWYFNGDGVLKDLGEAVKWFRSAAEKGDSAAQSRLSHCYFNGIGTGKDDVQAYAWAKLASFNGDIHKDDDFTNKMDSESIATGEALLGMFFLDGTGVQRNYTEALKRFHAAAKKDHAGAKYNIGECF